MMSPPSIDTAAQVATPKKLGRPVLQKRNGKQVTLYLNEEDMELARALGGGSASKGIREALAQTASKKTASFG